jgi:hypothetical protein
MNHCCPKRRYVVAVRMAQQGLLDAHNNPVSLWSKPEPAAADACQGVLDAAKGRCDRRSVCQKRV